MSGRDGHNPDGRGDNDTNFGKKPNQTILVPPEFCPEITFHDIKRLATTWKVESGCEVIPHTQRGRLVRFDLFGSGPKLDSAVRVVNKWIANAKTKSPASSAWAKLPAFDPNKWYYGELKSMETERKQMFKGPIPDLPVERTLHKVIVDWPEHFPRDESITPRDVFGNKLEALNSIRTDDEVFITLLPRRSPIWQVEICGFEIAHVLAGKQHFLNLAQKVYMQEFFKFQTITIILDKSEGTEVILQEAEKWWPILNPKIVPRLLPNPMMYSYEPGSFRKEVTDYRHLATIQHHIKRSLEAIRYTKGSYDFVIRYGCLTLSDLDNNEIGNKYSIERFSKGIEIKNNCIVRKWLANHALGDQLLTRLMAADHLLEPTKAIGRSFGFTPSTLKETRPTFRGTWVFGDPNKPDIENKRPAFRNPGRPTPIETKPNNGEAKRPPHNLIVVQIEWTEDEEGTYEKMPPRFYRLKPGKEVPGEHMDINLLELGEGKAWHFGLESMKIESKSTISPAVVGFAEKMKMKPGYQTNSNESFAQWLPSPSLKMRMGRIDKVYTFGVKKTGYQVEALAMWYPGQKMPCWGLTVRHAEWSTHLNVLERLPLGREADFGEIVETFLPEDGITASATKDSEVDITQLQKLSLEDNNPPPARDGIRLLVDKLLQISDVINNSGDSGGVPI